MKDSSKLMKEVIFYQQKLNFLWSPADRRKSTKDMYLLWAADETNASFLFRQPKQADIGPTPPT
jgi:hypothetical protein